MKCPYFTLYIVCELQAKGVDYWLRCALPAEVVQYGLRVCTISEMCTAVLLRLCTTG